MKKTSEDLRVEELGLQLVQCPSQPGRLTISNQSCAERYDLAQKKDHRFPKDEFGLALMSGLKTCRACPEGRYFWQNRDWPHFSHRGPGGKRRSSASGSQGSKKAEENHSEGEL